MRKAIVAATACMAVGLAGCASITRGTTNQVQIMSNPSEAHARTSMGHSCITPCTLQFNRKDEFTVTISKAGYHTAEIPVRVQVAGAGAAGFVGNVIVGGLIGMAVDASTGATLEHFPNPVSATLVPVEQGQQPQVIRIEPVPPPPVEQPQSAVPSS